MNTKFYSGLLLLFLAISFSSLAQDDYIILEDGTQTYGAVQYDSIKGIVYFKPEILDIYSEYEKSQIKEFKNEKIVYHKRIYDGKETFVLRLVDGDIRLYKIWNDYLLEDSNQLVTLSYRDHITGLRTILGEKCSWDFNEEYLRYSEGYMTQLVKGYNKKECFKVQKPHFGVRVSYGNVNSEIFLESEQIDVPFDNINVLVVGVEAEFPTYKNSSVVTSFEFISQSQSVPFQVLNFNSATVDVSHLVLNLGPRYYFGNFFLGGGFSLVYNFANKSAVVPGRFFAGTPIPVDVEGVGLGYHANVGYRIVNEINRSLSVKVGNKLWSGSDLTVGILDFGLFLGI